MLSRIPLDPSALLMPADLLVKHASLRTMNQPHAEKPARSYPKTHRGELTQLVVRPNGPPPWRVLLLLTGIGMIVSLKLLKAKSEARILSLWDGRLHGAAIWGLQRASHWFRDSWSTLQACVNSDLWLSPLVKIESIERKWKIKVVGGGRWLRALKALKAGMCVGEKKKYVSFRR